MNNQNKLQSLAKDLRQGPPLSPHEKLGGYVIAARSLVKCRAFLLGINGEYNFHPCGLSAFLWKFTGNRTISHPIKPVLPVTSIINGPFSWCKDDLAFQF